MERRSLRTRLELGDPTWPPQLAVAVAIGLHVPLSEQVSIGSRWTITAPIVPIRLMPGGIGMKYGRLTGAWRSRPTT